MKTLLKKFQASTALDRGGKPGQPAENQEVQRFAHALREMKRDFRESREQRAVPQGLHASVMRAVRQSRQKSEPVGFLRLTRPLAGVGLVLAVGLGVFMLASRPSTNKFNVAALAAVAPSLGAAFDQGRELTQAAPKTVLGPLSGEMELLDGDIRNAVNFLVASVP